MSGYLKNHHLSRRILALFSLVILAACTPNTASSTPLRSDSPEPSLIPVPTAGVTSTTDSTEAALPTSRVDPSTMENKLLMGYQGWFTCPGDGSSLLNGYFHWFTNNIPSAANFRVAMWPDTSELSPAEQCPTSMVFPNGQPASLYSAYNPKTVLRHFEWMSQYGIDGIFLQRFGSELSSPDRLDERNVVTKNVIAGAQATGRVFAIMYDTSGMDSSTFVSVLENDWKYLVDVLKVTDSQSYLHQNGKPVLAIWGLGFAGHPGAPQQAMDLVNFFKNNPDPTLQVTLMGGVPTDWRTLQKDSLTDPGWAAYYCALNVISPWTVERFKTDAQVDQYKSTMILDMEAANQCGAEYMPVVFPGYSSQNSTGTAYNVTPRRGGNLYWRQVYNAISIKVPMIYNAMFDEVDEGTAMYKIAATTNDQPVGASLVPLNADGYNLPSDWYLQLAGAAAKMLRGEIPLTVTIPIQPGTVSP